jgi:hypothetical protein
MLIFCQAYKDHIKQLVRDGVNLWYYCDTDDSYRTVQNQQSNFSLTQNRTRTLEEMVLWTVVGLAMVDRMVVEVMVTLVEQRFFSWAIEGHLVVGGRWWKEYIVYGSQIMSENASFFRCKWVRNHLPSIIRKHQITLIFVPVVGLG